MLLLVMVVVILLRFVLVRRGFLGSYILFLDRFLPLVAVLELHLLLLLMTSLLTHSKFAFLISL